MSSHANLHDLFVAHYTRLVRLAALLLDDLASCEDVVAEAFAKLHTAHLRDPDKALAYLQQSVVNLSRSSLRHRSVVQRHARAAARPVVAMDPVFAAVDRDALKQALRGLQRRQREAIILRYYLDLDVSAAAEVMGCSPGAVKAYASRGIAALSGRLETLR
ncbi:MAG: polymerase, sigma-24 subunit, subfamily [Frankiales bacterium]|nr:polymerase, sigma-24 subunit, subfamily [Frankiales bacterium]